MTLQMPLKLLRAPGGEVEAPALRADDLHVQVGQAAGHRQRQPHHARHRHRPPVQVVEQRPLLVVLRDKPELSPRPIIYPEKTRLFSFMNQRTSIARFVASSAMHTNSSSGHPPGTELRTTARVQVTGAGTAKAILGQTPRISQDSHRTLVVGSNKAQDVFVSQHNRLIDFCLPKPGSLVSGGEDFHSHIFPAPFSTPDFAKSAFSYDFLKDNCPCNCSLYKQG